MITTRTFVLVAASLLVTLTGCRSKNKTRRIAAEVGGQIIYVDELDEKIVAEVFELRSMALTR